VDSILQEEGVDGIQMVVAVDGNQMEVDDIQVVVVDSIQVEGVADGILMEVDDVQVVGVVEDVQVVVGVVDGIHEVDERAVQ